MHNIDHETKAKPEYAFRSLSEMLRYRAATQPDDVAYTFLLNGEEETDCVTYSELDSKAQRLASELREHLSPGDRGLLLYPSSLNYVASFFGCLYAGVVPVPSYPPKRNKADHRLQSIVRDAEPAALLCQEDTFHDLEKRIQETPELENLHWFATDRVAHREPSARSEPDVDPDTLAFLQYTSGSTSTPKGVMVSHGNLLQNMKECDLSWGFRAGGIIVTWLPIFHDLGLIFGILQPVYSGIPCVFMPPLAFLQKPFRWLQAISKYKGTHSAAPNFAYDLCVDKIAAEQRSDLDLTCWDMAMNAAEPVRAPTMRRFTNYFAPVGFRSKTFSPAFGLAEGTLKVTATCHHEDSVFAEFDSADLGRHTASPTETNSTPAGTKPPQHTVTLVSSGHTIGDTRLVIADPDTGKQCSENQVGEIWASGPIIAKGYWRRPKETAATFQARLSDASDERPFLRTGDLGFLRNGECFVTGRLKDVIIIRGINHYPQDIEWTVQQAHAALRPDCGAAFSIVDDNEERLVVVQEVRRTSLKHLNPDEVFQAVRRAIFDSHGLSVHAVALLRTASVLKTSSGKIQRQACKDRFLRDQFPTVSTWRDADGPDLEATGPSPPISLDSAQQWITAWVARKYTRAPRSISPRVTFDSCGMDSVSALEFAHDLGLWIGQDLDETIVWSYPTIEALSLHVTGASGRSAEPRTPPHSSPSDDPSLDELSEDELVGLLYDEIGRATPDGD
jgi:acyl-CoA synthetase (AMP-forming)/AMP-acid ligase II